MKAKTCTIVAWNRKVLGKKDFYNDVNDPSSSKHTLCGLNEVTVTKKQYDNVLDKLDDLPKSILNKTKIVSVDNWGKSQAVVIKAPGKRKLAIDTQGYNYARYKSFVK